MLVECLPDQKEVRELFSRVLIHRTVRGMLKTQDFSGSKGGAKVGALAWAGMYDSRGLLYDF